MSTREDQILQVGYVSTAVRLQSPEVMHAILAASRRNNSALNVTGLLVAGRRRYLQVIEGPAEAIEDLLSKIEADERHKGLVIFLRRIVQERSFGEWSMAFRGSPTLSFEGDYRRALEWMTRGMEEGRLKQQILAFARLCDLKQGGFPSHLQAISQAA
ncbi:BLUF domain-containing protein [Sphingomonas kaistensis]|uniref:BLUF domain-containing protein n=1 Tax=Sphingomonas kaistensis TaxID=298708 RepID=A0ABZ2G1J5_9SPHN